MMIKVALACVMAATGIGVLPSGTAAAAETPPTASVRIVHRPAELTADGGVKLALTAKCDTGLQAFELDVSVSQAQASGSLFRLAPPAVVVCDGFRHRQTVIVYPSTGTFATGVATVSVFIGFYDPQQDQDLAGEDSATVKVVQN